MEELHDIPGWSGIYSITKSGRVWSHERRERHSGTSERVRPGRWIYPTQKRRGYMQFTLQKDGRKQYTHLHRLLGIVFMGATKGQLIDHVDGIPSNNNLSNLRVCSPSENVYNSRPSKGGYSKFKGVSFFKKSGKWSAGIRIDGKQTYLGCFDTEIEAAKAYEEKAKEIHGEFFRSSLG